ncbi:hypothetical protein [Glycomyces dulcitolivorans]|uniref:hypothetical protein n=1 Tax=Glycomyces dulcitolivorans TaxID=2200759 RepID=UPI000DD41FE9|nr:hypothetical protein [Glycomyces dulcitolivorans]
MRRTLRLLLLLGIGLALAGKKPGGGDSTPGGGDNDVDPLTGRPKDSDERKERLDFQGKNASTEMAEVHDTADTEAKTGRAGDSDGDGQPDITDPQKPVEGPAAKIDPGMPNKRHNLNQIRPNNPAKNENTIVLPGTDVAGDIADIKAGNATWNPDTQRYEVNGRIYGMEMPSGTLFPVSGDGFVNLNRAEYQVLKEMMGTNGDLDQARQNISRNPYLNQPGVWDAALDVFQHSNRYQG